MSSNLTPALAELVSSLAIAPRDEENFLEVIVDREADRIGNCNTVLEQSKNQMLEVIVAGVDRQGKLYAMGTTNKQAGMFILRELEDYLTKDN